LKFGLNFGGVFVTDLSPVGADFAAASLVGGGSVRPPWRRLM
jgi:hypothetical protein